MSKKVSLIVASVFSLVFVLNLVFWAVNQAACGVNLATLWIHPHKWLALISFSILLIALVIYLRPEGDSKHGY